MNYFYIKPFIERCIASFDSTEIRWCDNVQFARENMAGVSPGGFLNPFGYFVVGTTIGGNAIVVCSAGDGPIYFADHTWYSDSWIHYQDLAGDEDWKEMAISDENVKKSLYRLAEGWDAFIALLQEGRIDQTIEDID